MNLAKLKQSEQILLATVLSILILATYSFARFIPQYSDITKLDKKAQSTQRKLLKARVPEEPDFDLEQLNAKLTEQEKTIEIISHMAHKVEQRLAPIDSQQLKVEISQLARDNKVRITANERIIGQAKPVQIVKSKSKSVPSTINNIVLPATENWINRMSPNSLFYRPLQRLELEGDYLAIRTFINELDSLPWQVTVVRMQIASQPITPLRGYAQALKAELVLAL